MTPKRPRCRRLTVSYVPATGFDPWRVYSPYDVATRLPTRAAALAWAARYARNNATAARPYSLRVRNRNGRWAEERTYPRGADPRRSKG